MTKTGTGGGAGAGLMWTNMLRAFQVGNAQTVDVVAAVHFARVEPGKFDPAIMTTLAAHCDDAPEAFMARTTKAVV